jgi:membrane fusion protein, copper/silver efflux system
MKKNWKNSIVYILFSLLLFASCNKGSDHAEHDVYTCPMHPTVISDKQGTCPICGMDLVRKVRPGEELEITSDLTNVIKAPNQSVVSSIKTTKPVYKSVPLSIEAVGIVTYDTRKIYTISARVSGRLEKIYLKYEFQPVRKGQKIAEIYSPELVTAQREFLYLVENDPGNDDLIESAKRKLMLLGYSARQVQDLIDGKTAGNTFVMYSQYDGYVITGEVPPKTMAPSSTIKGDMSSSTNLTPSGRVGSDVASTFPIRDGNYVTVGQTLVKIVDTNAIRVDLDLAQEHVGMIRQGDKIEVDFGNGIKRVASIDFVQPFFNEDQNFLKVRLYIDKLEMLPIGQLVQANIELNSKESLWIPKQSVIDLGNEKIVFIKDRGTLEPKRIATGIISDEFVEVKSGLATSDEIAFNAQYLVDSESFIKPMN